MKPLITNKLYMAARPGHYPYPTDNFYVRLANNIFRILMENYLEEDVLDEKTLMRMALKATWYFEDIVADMGIWRSFSEQCQRLYGFPVPMYHYSEDYYADEPSLNAVKYLVWDAISEMNDDMCIYPDTNTLKSISMDIYEYLNSTFEHAPVNDDEKEDIRYLIEHSTDGFNELRESLYWLNTGNYLTRNISYKDDVDEAVDDLNSDSFMRLDEDMKQYYIKTNFIFRYKTGPLALLSYEWLADLARVYDMDREQKLLENIEVLKPDTYRYTQINDDWLHLESIHGKDFDARRDEITMSDDQLNEHDGFISQFVFFNGEYHLNGLLAAYNFGDKFDELREETKESDKILPTEKLLEATCGKRILYFKDTDEMTERLNAIMPATNPNILQFPNDKDHIRPCFFINEKEPKNNIFIAFNMEEYIKDDDNPYYDAKEAADNAVTLLWERQAPAAFVDYLIDHNLLPDVKNNRLFGCSLTKNKCHSDMHFMVRYSRRNRM